MDSSSPFPAPFGKKNPFPAPLLVHRRLCGEGSIKDIRHFEIALQGSGLSYECGDSLAVIPRNDPEYIDRLLHLLHADGEEFVPTPDGTESPFRHALLQNYAITGVPRKFFTAFAERSGDAHLQSLAQPDMRKELALHLEGREIIDLFLAHPQVSFSPQEFVALLGKLPPRLYSIASSLKRHPGEVHLTVARVAYETHGIRRKGVCSTFLADRLGLGEPSPVFVQTAKGFKLPADGSTSIIMVGPGTGVAPFRAFLEERDVTGATGRNWLFFGNPHSKTDYCYGDEFEAWKASGFLTRLDLAWSRDQGQKVYVQHKLREHAAEVWSWLDSGAIFYVCGDASKMAQDVDDALHDIVREQGGRSQDDAAAYVAQLKKDHRYQRDVY